MTLETKNTPEGEQQLRTRGCPFVFSVYFPIFQGIKIPRYPIKDSGVSLVDDIGLEPMTFRTSSGCSSQLS